MFSKFYAPVFGTGGENARLITIFADGQHECLDTEALTVEQRDLLHRLAGSFAVAVDTEDVGETPTGDESNTSNEMSPPITEGGLKKRIPSSNDQSDSGMRGICHQLLVNLQLSFGSRHLEV